MKTNIVEEARLEYFFRNSQNRRLRRRMAKRLGMMKNGWQNIKEEFPPYNQPKNLGINKFKRSLKETSLNSSDKHKAVLQYKAKARKAVNNIITKED